MKIQVTQRHIDSGVPKSSTKCPIAMALNEALGITVFTYVTSSEIESKFYKHSEPIQEWIRMFDHDHSSFVMHPIEIELRNEERVICIPFDALP